MISRTFADAFSRMAPYAGALPYSYSRAQTLERCPLQFEYQYRTKGTPRGTPSSNDDTRVGWLAHKILECTVKNAKSTQILTTAGGDFDGTFENWLERADNDSQKSMLLDVREPMKKALADVLKMVDGCTLYVERELQFAADGTHRQTIGVPWETRRRNRSGLGLLGFVDLEAKRDGHLMVFDWKTEFPSEARRKSVEGQMGLYAFCELESRPAISSVSTYCVYLKNSLVDPVGEYDRGAAFEELRRNVSRSMNAYIEALKRFGAEKRPNDYCKYCGFVELCESTRSETADDGTKKD